MKVLITLPVKVGFDGMTKQILSYGKFIDRKDLEIDLLSCRGYDPDMKHLVDESKFNNVYRMEYRDTNQLKYFRELLKLIKLRKYDVIHANGQSATLAIEMLAGLLGGCKLRIAHSHNSMCQHLKIHKLLYPLFSVTYNDAIACSKEAGDWLFKNRKYWLLPNGIDIDIFRFDIDKRNKTRQELNIKDDELAVGHVGAFEPWKNQDFLLDIFKEINNENKKIKLFLWGIDGSTKESTLDKISKYNLNETIIYKGTTDHINNYLNAMDLMVLPSWYEGFPVTSVEWQANGLTCLLSDTITKDTNITGLVKYLSINNGTDCWKDEILNFKKDIKKRESQEYPNKLIDNGYDIKNNAKELKNHYINKLNYD